MREGREREGITAMATEIDLPPFRVIKSPAHTHMRPTSWNYDWGSFALCNAQPLTHALGGEVLTQQLHSCQVPVNADGSFLAFGQGTSGTVTRAVDTRPGGGAVALKSIPVTLRFSPKPCPATVLLTHSFHIILLIFQIL